MEYERVSVSWNVIRTVFLSLFVVSLIVTFVFFMAGRKSKNREWIDVKSEYSWFLDETRKIVFLANAINEMNTADERCSANREKLELLVWEYNLKAVMLFDRSEWNCVAPYQHSMVELLYGRVARENKRRKKES